MDEQENAISDMAKRWVHYIRTWYTGYWDPSRNDWVQPKFPTNMWSVAGSIVAEEPHTNCSVEGWNSALNRDAPLQPNLWKLILKFRQLEATAVQEWRRQVLISFGGFGKIIYRSPPVQGGAGNLTNTTRRGSKYLGAKEKNARVRRVIINKNYDLIESKPGIAGAYFEYLQMIEAAHDP